MSDLSQLSESVVRQISLAADEKLAKDTLGDDQATRVPNLAAGCEIEIARCAAPTPGKARGCRRRPILGSAYCGQHKSLDPRCARRQVPCPLDCRHSVWADQVGAHVKVCETKRRAERVATAQLLETSRPYYCRNINGQCTEGCCPDAKSDSTEPRVEGRSESEAGPSLADPLTWLRKVVKVSEQHFGTRLPRLYADVSRGIPQSISKVGTVSAHVQATEGSRTENNHRGVVYGTGEANEDDDNESDNGSDKGSDDENQLGGGGEVTGTKIERAMKHALQEEAVAQHLQFVGLLPSSTQSSSDGNESGDARETQSFAAEDRSAMTALPRFSYVEFGAGAGGLAFACARAAAAAVIDPNHSEPRSNGAGGNSEEPNLNCSVDQEAQSSSIDQIRARAKDRRPNVVLVERLPFPPSTDRRWLAQPLVENGLAAALASPLKAPGFLRCQLDIRDFKMGGVSAARPDVDLRAAPPVAIGKHLCGAATDLTITAVIRQCRSENKGGGKEVESDEDLVGPLKGVAIVTCCHGLCTWQDYPTAAKKWLRDMLPVAPLRQTELTMQSSCSASSAGVATDDTGAMNVPENDEDAATNADDYTAGNVNATNINLAAVKETASSLSCAEFECLCACSHWAVDGGRPNEQHHPNSRIWKRNHKRAAAAALHLAQLEASAAQEEEVLIGDAGERDCLAFVPGADGSTNANHEHIGTSSRPAAAALAQERARRSEIERTAVAAKLWRRGLTAQERKRIGRACKYLLDGGRRECLRQYGQWNDLQCDLFELIGSDVTPENTLLLAWPTRSQRKDQKW